MKIPLFRLYRKLFQCRLPAVASLFAKNTNVFFIQVGALDGVSFDPFYPLIAANPHWCGIVVEPVTSSFLVLQQTYKGRTNIKQVQAAIDPEKTSVVLHYAEPSFAAKNPDYKGMSSIYTDRNALDARAIPPARKGEFLQALRSEQVAAMSLTRLCEQEGVQIIDWLQIDTEGHDYHVLRSLDFTKYAPRYIHLEYYNLPIEEQEVAFNLLRAQGYRLKWDHKDILAQRA